MSRRSSRLEDIASAAEVIIGKSVQIYCDEDIFAKVVQEKTHWRIGLGSTSVYREECEIHALARLMHSPISLRDVRVQAGSLAADLFAALEHNRIDRITSSWYDRDMFVASAKHINLISASSEILVQELLNMLYGKPLSGIYSILEKYGKNIEAAVKSSSPTKALETAIAISSELGCSTSELLVKSQPELDKTVQLVDQENPEKEIPELTQESAKALINSINKKKGILEGNGNHKYRIFHPEMVLFKGMGYCSYILNQWSGSKPLYRTAIHGIPRYNVWALNYGKTKVFNKRVVSAGKVVVLVDLSASMKGFQSAKQAGYLAFQAANLITGSACESDVDIYGFTGSTTENVIIPLKAGYVPKEPVRYSDEYPLLGVTPMCVALQFLSTVYQGAEASIAVLITDGNPTEAVNLSQDHVINHTRELAYSLHESGMRYLLIQVDTEGLDRLYPAEITVHLNCEEDLLEIPLAMSAMIG